MPFTVSVIQMKFSNLCSGWVKSPQFLIKRDVCLLLQNWALGNYISLLLWYVFCLKLLEGSCSSQRSPCHFVAPSCLLCCAGISALENRGGTLDSFVKISIALRVCFRLLALVVPRADGNDSVPESEQTKLELLLTACSSCGEGWLE